MRRLKSTFPSLARIRLGDMESWAFKFGAEVFFSCLFMSYSNDLSPPKLVLCEVIRHSYGTNPQDSSESCQELYNLLSPSDLDQLKQVQLNYLHKLYDGWEPDRKEAYLFLLQYQPGSAFINQILTEWENLVQESDEFIPWMVQLQEWRSQYMDEQDESSLLVFVSSVVASFHLIPFSSYYLIADLLCDYLQEKNQVVSFPSPFPSFSPYFTEEQYRSWENAFQLCLFQQQGTFDIDTLKTQLLSISPPPYPLLASLSFLQNDFQTAHSYLLQSISTTPTIKSILLPLTFYSLAYRSRAIELLHELVQVCQLSRETEMESILSFMSIFTEIESERILQSIEITLKHCQGKRDFIPVSILFLRFLLFYPSFLKVKDGTFCRSILDEAGFVNSSVQSVSEGLHWLSIHPKDYYTLLHSYIDLKSSESPYVTPVQQLSTSIHSNHIQNAIKFLRKGVSNSLLQVLGQWQSMVDCIHYSQEKLWNETLIAVIRGIWLEQQNRYEEGLNTIHKAFEICKEKGLQSGASMCVVSEAFCLSRRGTLTTVMIESIREALKVFVSLRLVKAVRICLYLVCLDSNRWNQLKNLAIEQNDGDLICLVEERELYLNNCSLQEFVSVCMKYDCLALALNSIHSHPSEKEIDLLMEQIEREQMKPFCAVCERHPFLFDHFGFPTTHLVEI